MRADKLRLFRTRAGAWLLITGLLALAAGGGAQAATCRVTTSGGTSGTDGSNWTAQAMALQFALSNSTTCPEIWVKGGTYTPTTTAYTPTTTDRSISFNILPGVQIYGGFGGAETQRSDRNPVANLTTLSGDIGAPGDSTDNSYHVVVMDGTTNAGNITASTVLDGFTISAGNGDGSPVASFGAGMYCNGEGNGHQCSPTISNVTFSGNSAIYGGAMYNDGKNGISSPTLSNVVFSSNSAPGDTNGSGGAMFNFGFLGDSSPTLDNVTFSDNTAGYVGGAMYNFGGTGISSPTLSNVTFSGNQVTASNGLGGAMYNDGRNSGSVSSPTLSNVTFAGNSAALGGAMVNDGNGGTSSPTLSNATFSGNYAASIGGAIVNSGSGSNPALYNVIAWGDTFPEIFNAGAAATIDFSVIQGGCPASSTCLNVFVTDPQLGPLADNGGFTQTMLLGSGSSAIDSGANAICETSPVNGLDQRGVSRPQGQYCDIGAVEMIVDEIFKNGFESGN